eukprot:TRINITY_DN8914_c0_g1_i3.p1 TRINITY_DN8914_c0_g1~~TRINITY_DN8914_c0_g1_i3.p1  ORF type:complete len:341 (+),score=67.16 TRINITY_DN8914_c0_g1_i3:49-1023(+)
MKSFVYSTFLILLPGTALGQGQQCSQPSDCTSEYAPYCSKWGWCVWTSLYGEEGPPQSFGAEEDGERGQCRDDSDCTRWAPICSPLGYCRSGFWDGSFGAPSNPRPGQEPSQWIKDNAAKFRTGTKENPNPNNVNTGGQSDRKQATSSGGSRKAGGGGGKGSRRSGGGQGSSRRSGGVGAAAGGRKSSEAPRGGGKNSQYEDQIKAGRIPGEAGKDYPTNSIKSLRNKYPGIEAAPKDKIPKNYPARKQGGSNGHRPAGGGRDSSGGRRSNGNRGGNSGQNRASGGQSGKGCPGSLDDCMASCPSEIKVFKACVASCGRRCRKK